MGFYINFYTDRKHICIEALCSVSCGHCPLQRTAALASGAMRAWWPLGVERETPCVWLLCAVSAWLSICVAGGAAASLPHCALCHCVEALQTVLLPMGIQVSLIWHGQRPPTGAPAP